MKTSNKLIDWKKIDWKKIAPVLVALAAFIGFALYYCSPILKGQVVYAGDTINWQGAAHQTQEYKAQTGESCWWTNSQFGGMPTYQIDSHIPSHKVSHGYVRNVLHLGLQETLGIVFGYLLGFYILLLCFGVNAWLSIAGAFAMGLSTYFLLIIPAGHVTKAIALGFLPALIGGMHLLFKKKYWLGVPIILLFGMTSIMLHPQMTYYIVLLAGVMALAEIYPYLRKKAWKDLGIVMAVMVACVLLMVGTKVCYLKLNREYLNETMRGGHSELTQKVAEDEEGNAEKAKENTTKGGLDIDYATAWSYGIDETMTLMIPNWEGAASGYNIGANSQLGQTVVNLMKDHKVPRNNAQKYVEARCEHSPSYHGEKPFTSGAVYVGAVVCFLFLLGLLIVPGPYKWALLVATLMSIFLAWGKNMMWLTEIFFNHFPMYNKFRAVESILIVAEITMPLLGFMGLNKIINGEVDWKKLRRSLFIAGGVTAGICLAIALSAKSINMSSSYDRHIFEERDNKLVMVQRGSVDGWADNVANELRQGGIKLTEEEVEDFREDCHDAIHADRAALLKADAWRSFIFVVAGFLIVFGFAWLQHSFGNKVKYKVGLVALLIGIILVDMVPVNKRFFNDKNYWKPKDIENYFFKKTDAEKEILRNEKVAKGQIPNFRVLNISQALDQDARTCYYMNSLGGYSAVKLRRYQDLINEHISKGNINVLNMLNTKYFIQGNQYQLNDGAFGNAWFVNEVQFVPTPDDESNALYTLDVSTKAVADEKFRNVLTCEAQPSESDKIELTKCTPNRLTYTANVAHDRVAVFSEIYYPHGWHLYVDGKEVQIGRVNYVLRAAIIPAGQHTLVMEFVPDGLSRDKLGYALVILALLICLGCLTWPLWKNIPWKKLPIKKG